MQCLQSGVAETEPGAPTNLQRVVLGGQRRLLQPLLLRLAPHEPAPLVAAAPLLALLGDRVGGLRGAVAGAVVVVSWLCCVR